MNSTKTRSYQKLERQILIILELEEFENDILQARGKLGINKNGIVLSDEDKSNVAMPLYIPSSLRKNYTEKDLPFEKEAWLISDRYSKKLPINNFWFFLVVRAYLLYNKIFIKEILENDKLMLPKGLCGIRDESELMKKILFSEDFHENIHGVNNDEAAMANRVYVLTQSQHLKNFPISLSIHPDASQRDIIDYIKTNWSAVQSLQDKYKDEEKSIRHARIKTNPEIKKRNQIILKNKHLPAKEIRKLLSKNGYYLDDGHILKIISLNRPENK